MILIATVRAGAGSDAKRRAKSNTLPCPVQRGSTDGIPGIFRPLVISRMNRAEIEIEHLTREKALKK